MTITNGTVFKFNHAPEEYMVCDRITHRWNSFAQCIEALEDPHILFRSVANINAWKPVHEMMKISFAEFHSSCTVLPLSDRIKSTSNYEAI